MKIDITTLDGAASGSLDLDDSIFGLEPREDLHRPHGALAARQAPRRHPCGEEPRGHRPHRQEDVQAEGHRRPVTAPPACRSSAAAVAPSVRSCARHAHDLPKKVRALALKHALSAKAKDGAHHRHRRRANADAPKTEGARRTLRQARSHQRADHRRRRGRTRTSRSPPATSRTSTCCRSRASTSTTSSAARSSC